MTINVLISVNGEEVTVPLPVTKWTFMLRCDESINEAETKELLFIIGDYFNKFSMPEHDFSFVLWQNTLKGYTKDQILWGLKKYATQKPYTPRASDLIEICEERRRKQNEELHFVCQCFKEIFEIMERGLTDVASEGRPVVKIADDEEKQRTIDAFFNRCYEVTNGQPSSVARNLTQATKIYVIGEEKAGRLKNLKPLHLIVKKINLEYRGGDDEQ